MIFSSLKNRKAAKPTVVKSIPGQGNKKRGGEMPLSLVTNYRKAKYSWRRVVEAAMGKNKGGWMRCDCVGLRWELCQ